MRAIVDTNVLKVANRETPQASLECELACIRIITEIKQSGILILDDEKRILNEYRGELNIKGQPGVGDAFLKWAYTNMMNKKRCELIPITPLGPQNFTEFPSCDELRKFHWKDRKFVAVACATPIILRSFKPSIRNGGASRTLSRRKACMSNSFAGTILHVYLTGRK